MPTPLFKPRFLMTLATLLLRRFNRLNRLKQPLLVGLWLGAGWLATSTSLAQAQSPATGRATTLGWQVCQAMTGEPAAQLKCFQDWAASQGPANSPAPQITMAPANPENGQPAMPVLLPALNTEAPDGKPIGCRNDKYSEMSRFWELQRATDCDTFALRGYRPCRGAGRPAARLDDDTTHSVTDQVFSTPPAAATRPRCTSRRCMPKPA